MPYKSKVKKRIYQRELMRRRRGSNNNTRSSFTLPDIVRPSVRPSKGGKGKPIVRPSSKARDDLRTDLPGGECIWGWDESQGEPMDDSLRTDLPGGECVWGFDDTKNTRK